MPLTLDLIVQEGITPAESLASDRALLDSGSAALRLYTLAGDVVALGRYHFAPDVPASAGVQLWRRWSGGRAMPWGDGFIGLSLVLPHRSALVSDDPLALAPEQVMNRCVRGILAACESAGVSAFYPGRDTVTVEGRLLGTVSFEVEASGALVFEAAVANARDASVLPALIDRADPAGVVPVAMLTAADVTSLAAHVGRPLALADFAARCRAGYAERLGVSFVDAVAERATFDAGAWLGTRRPRADLDRRFSLRGQLGTVEILFARDGARVRDLTVAGDVIAASTTIAAIEDRLRGCPAERVEGVIGDVLASRDAFLLGLGSAPEVAAAIARGVAA